MFKTAILNRFREPSSWAGLAVILANIAAAVATKDAASVSTIIAAVLAILLPEGAVKK